MRDPLQKIPERRYNNYTIGIGSGVLVGIGVSLALLLMFHLAWGAIPEWLYYLLCLLYGVISASQVVSGIGYSTTEADIAFRQKTAVQAIKYTYKKKYKGQKFIEFMSERKIEFWGLILGLALSIALTVFLAVKHAAEALSSFAKHIPVVGTIIFFLANVSMISGLCSRLGRCTDYLRNNERAQLLRGENVNYVIAVVVGVILGILIAGLILGLAGVTTTMTAGGLLPTWFGIGLAVLNFVSTTASASGYIGRIFDFFFWKRIIGLKKDITIDHGLKSRANAERVGTLIGVGLGAVCALVLIGIVLGLGLATIPVFGLGLPVAAASVIVLVTFISGMGGLANRLGFLIDKYKRHGGDAEHGKGDSVVDVKPQENQGPDRDAIFDPLLNSKDGEQTESFNFEAPVQSAVTKSALQRVSNIKDLVEKSENTEKLDAENIDSGRRSPDPRNAEISVDTSGLYRVGSSRCEFFRTTSRETISRSDSAGLDVTRNKWTDLRQKAENRKINATHPHHHDYRASRRREQVEGLGNGSRRLCY